MFLPPLFDALRCCKTCRLRIWLFYLPGFCAGCDAVIRLMAMPGGRRGRSKSRGNCAGGLSGFGMKLAAVRGRLGLPILISDFILNKPDQGGVDRLMPRPPMPRSTPSAAVDEHDRAASSLEPSSRTWTCIPSMAMKRDGGPAEILNADAFFSSRSSDSCLFGVWQRWRPRPVDNKQHSCSTRRRLESSVLRHPRSDRILRGCAEHPGFHAVCMSYATGQRLRGVNLRPWHLRLALGQWQGRDSAWNRFWRSG